MASDRPIFVVGCPRSGTTMLQLMLHSHPRIAVPPENRYFLRGYQNRAGFGDLRDPANRRALGEFITKRRQFRDFKLDREMVIKAIVEAPPTLGSAYETVMREFAAANGKQRWCDKRPAYLHHTDAILRLFPDAQFVHLIRDGRSCVASLKRMPWWKGGAEAGVVHWVTAIDRGRAMKRRMPPGTWFEFQYEKLVGDPETELRALCAFLNEEFDPAMLSPELAKAGIVPNRKRWHANTAGSVSTGRVESWRSELERDELQLIEYVARRQLRAYGYEVTGELGRPPAPVLAAHVAQLAKRKAQIAARHAKDAVAARNEPPVRSMYTAEQRAGKG
jgi:hypothetical protein